MLLLSSLTTDSGAKTNMILTIILLKLLPMNVALAQKQASTKHLNNLLAKHLLNVGNRYKIIQLSGYALSLFWDFH